MEYKNFKAEDENAGDNEELAFSDNEGEFFFFFFFTEYNKVVKIKQKRF